MNTEEKIKLVERRLYFINQLTEIRDHFRGRDITTRINNLIEIDHQYIHYSALRIYLALTCFDILGQDDDWLDFNSWLKSKKKRKRT